MNQISSNKPKTTLKYAVSYKTTYLILSVKWEYHGEDIIMVTHNYDGYAFTNIEEKGEYYYVAIDGHGSFWVDNLEFEYTREVDGKLQTAFYTTKET